MSILFARSSSLADTFLNPLSRSRLSNTHQRMPFVAAKAHVGSRGNLHSASNSPPALLSRARPHAHAHARAHAQIAQLKRALASAEKALAEHGVALGTSQQASEQAQGGNGYVQRLQDEAALLRTESAKVRRLCLVVCLCARPCPECTWNRSCMSAPYAQICMHNTEGRGNPDAAEEICPHFRHVVFSSR